MKYLNFIKDNLAFFIPVMLFLGLLKGHWFPMEYSRVICISALLVMILPVFINLEFDKGFQEFNSTKKPLIIATVINFLIYPLFAYLIGWIFLQNHPGLWLGLILLSLVPTSGMTINWTYFTKGNMPLAMSIVSVSILLSFIFLPLLIPLFSNLLMASKAVEVNQLVILEKLFFIIVIPLSLGWFIRNLIIKFKGRETFSKIKPVNASISAIGVLIVSFLVMSLEATQTIWKNPEILLLATIPVLLFYAVIFLVSHLIGNMFFNKEHARSLFFATAARYHVITLGIVLGTFQSYDFLGLMTIVIALGLAIQIPSLAFYARWLQNRKDELDALSEF